MPITRDQQMEIRTMTEEMVRRICLDDTFMKKIAEKVSSSVLEIIENKLSQFEKKLDEVKNSVYLLDRKYDERIIGLTNQIVELQKKLEDNGRESPNVTHIVSEVNEIRRRESNILIFGIPEDSTDEAVYALDVCREIIPDLDAGDIKAHRVGRRQPDKTRPVKIHFMDSSHVSIMLKNKKKLAFSVTETWLRDGVSDSELFPGNYSVYRKDRAYGVRGGGVLLAVNDDLFTSELCELEYSVESVDMVYVKISVASGLLFYVILLYIPPDSNINVYNDIFEILEDLNSPESVMILGDFNISALQGYYETNESSSLLLRYQSFVNFANLVQNNFVTNCNNRLLDLVLTSEYLKCDVLNDPEPLVPIDTHHPCITVRLSLQFRQKNIVLPSIKQYNFSKIDNQKFVTLMNGTDWNFLKSLSDSDDEDIRHLYEWCTENELPLNISKCKVMSYSRKLTTEEFNYNIGNHILKRVNECKDLGVLFDSKLTFDLHIDSHINDQQYMTCIGDYHENPE
ncbi:uncharacterized protein LOC123306264 [Coccinella septempunctata]|uniref:uncharacterized protein LOC123306264 n=1 Tax=Coccinella septempunctata TaxID=41139 RepID=UPI001D096A2A|nr:uncharacterized protein LOC123306264 [Coccinella septempunctata]